MAPELGSVMRRNLYPAHDNGPLSDYVNPYEGPVDWREVTDCTCVTSCDEHPPTACSLSGEPHQHPDDPCPVHPDVPGDR